MSRWFRFYDDAINDPKLLKLSDNLFRFWVGILCIASKNEGVIPCAEDVALLVRSKLERTKANLNKLVELGLLDCGEGGSRTPHNWGKRQFKSDTSTERVKRFRNVSSTVSETAPDTEQKQIQKDVAASAAPVRLYAFESGVIRLTAKDFEKWKVAFSRLDLAAELIALAPWAAEQREWFHAVAGALAKRNRELKIRADQVQQGNGLPLTPSGNPWPEGIV